MNLSAAVLNVLSVGMRLAQFQYLKALYQMFCISLSWTDVVQIHCWADGQTFTDQTKNVHLYVW